MIKKSEYKYVLQRYDYDCGVAATVALLVNSGVKRTNYLQISKDLQVSSMGVRPKNIVNYFLRFPELKPRQKFNSNLDDLNKELKAGRMCMVAYQSWGTQKEVTNLECGHYAVAVGIEGNKLYLLDPTAYKDWGNGVGWRVMTLTNFEKKWVDIDKGKKIRGWMISIKPIKN